MEDEEQQRRKALDDFLSTFAHQRREYQISIHNAGGVFLPPKDGDGSEWQFQAFQSTATAGIYSILWSRVRKP